MDILTYILFLLSFYLIRLMQSKSLSFPFYINYNTKTIAIQGMLGSSKISVDFCLDLSNNYSTIFSLQNYIEQNSTTLEISGHQEKYLNMSGNISTDIVYFQQENIDSAFQLKTTFLFLGDKTKQTFLPIPVDLSSACLSLSRSPTSFLQQLYSSTIISKKIALLGLTKLDIGEIDPSVESRMQKCSIVPFKHQWGCRITGMGFNQFLNDENNNTNETDSNATSNHFKYYLELNSSVVGYFSTMTNDILLPSEYQKEFIDNYFGKTFFNKNCKMIEVSKFKEGISCRKKSLRRLTSISFIFDNKFGVKLNGRKLFSSENRGRNIRIFRIKFVRMLNHIIFGHGFIREFNLVLNEDEDYVGLAPMTSPVFSFDGKYTILDESHSSLYFKLGLCAVMLLLLSGVVNLGYVWFGKIRSFDGKIDKSIDGLLM